MGPGRINAIHLLERALADLVTLGPSAIDVTSRPTDFLPVEHAIAIHLEQFQGKPCAIM